MNKSIDAYSNLKVYHLNKEISIEDKIKQFKDVLNKLSEKEQTLINTKLSQLISVLNSMNNLTNEFEEYYLDLNEEDKQYVVEYDSLKIAYLPLIHKSNFANDVIDDFNDMVGCILKKYYSNENVDNLKDLLNDDFSTKTKKDKAFLQELKNDVINVLNNNVSLNDLVLINDILVANGLNYDFFLNMILYNDDTKPILYNVNDLYSHLSHKFKFNNLYHLLNSTALINTHSTIDNHYDYNSALSKDYALFVYYRDWNKYWNITYANFENAFMVALKPLYFKEEDITDKTTETNEETAE